MWIAATQQSTALKKFLPPRKVREIRVHAIVEEILKAVIQSYPSVPRTRLTHFSLYLSSKLMFGSCVVLQKQAAILFCDIADVFKNIKLTRWSKEKNALVVQTSKKTKPILRKDPFSLSYESADDEEAVDWTVVPLSEVSFLADCVDDEENDALNFCNSVPEASITLVEDYNFSTPLEDLRFGDEDVERHPVYGLRTSDIYGTSSAKIIEVNEDQIPLTERNVMPDEILAGNDVTRRSDASLNKSSEHIIPYVLYHDNLVEDSTGQHFETDPSDIYLQTTICPADTDSRPKDLSQHHDGSLPCTAEQSIEASIVRLNDSNRIVRSPPLLHNLPSFANEQTGEAIANVCQPQDQICIDVIADPHINEVDHRSQHETDTDLITGQVGESNTIPQGEVHTDFVDDHVGNFTTPPRDGRADLITEHIHDISEELPDLEDTPRTIRRKRRHFDNIIEITNREFQKRLESGAVDTVLNNTINDGQVIYEKSCLTQPGRKYAKTLWGLVERNFRTHPMPTIDLRNPFPRLQMQSTVHESHRLETEDMPENNPSLPDLMTLESSRKRSSEEGKEIQKSTRAKRMKPSEAVQVEQSVAEKERETVIEDFETSGNTHQNVHSDIPTTNILDSLHETTVPQESRISDADLFVQDHPQSELPWSNIYDSLPLEHHETTVPPVARNSDADLPVRDLIELPVELPVFDGFQSSEQPRTNLPVSDEIVNANLLDRELPQLELAAEPPIRSSPHQSRQPETTWLPTGVPTADLFIEQPEHDFIEEELREIFEPSNEPGSVTANSVPAANSISPNPSTFEKDVCAQIEILAENANVSTISMDVLCPREATRRRRVGKIFESLLALNLQGKIELSQQLDGVTIPPIQIRKLNE